MEQYSEELQEWLTALDDMVDFQGKTVASSLLEEVIKHASRKGLQVSVVGTTPYTNTLLTDKALPSGSENGDLAEGYILWNAMAMVMRAGEQHAELGGHIATFASSSTLYRVGMDYFFKACKEGTPGDLVYYQGHASPGMYARSFLEGVFSEEDLDHFRQEASERKGLSSYPHPWLMPDYWQFATVSMGLGPLQGIWAAKWLKYMDDRGLKALNNRKVWVFCGDGEMDEPESRGCLHIAAEQRLEHLIFVVNCNLQRLDGPVRGNGKIIQELEKSFLGAGWKVIKVIWNSAWDKVFKLDKNGDIQAYLEEIVDGSYQKLAADGPKAIINDIMEKVPSVAEKLIQLPEDIIDQLAPGGHDPIKVYTAYGEATKGDGIPTVVLTHTQKGYGLGPSMAGANTTHQHKKLREEDLIKYAKLCRVKLSEKEIREVSYYYPGAQSYVVQWVLNQREKLGGCIPSRYRSKNPITPPKREMIEKFLLSSESRSISTTMVFVRLLMNWLKDDELKEVIVPIVADEARTFGMEGLFRQIGIYHPHGQKYTPVDNQQLMPYRESRTGQLLQEGINEAGALACWLAAATSYSHSQVPVLPCYIYYSMFGFQRVGDLIWAAGDMRARGFLLGATSGKTTLGGEGLQHCDGQSLMSASMVPNCVSYDPCYQYELAIIMQKGIERMLHACEDVFYYITLTNENDHQPAMPEGVEDMITQGMYPLKGIESGEIDIHLLGSGRILKEVELAQEALEKLGIKAKVWSVTSFTELARQARKIQRETLFGDMEQEMSYVQECLNAGKPVIAATDYVQAYADQIRGYINNPYIVLGTDGYGRSDARSHLRSLFQVDSPSIVIAALSLLSEQQDQYKSAYEELQKRYQQEKINIDPMEE